MSRPNKPRKPRTQSTEAFASAPGPKKLEKQRPHKLRIIGGSMRGRTVIYHGAAFTRPMKDSVRESLFNILGPRIKGSVVIDLFAGTGAVAFESLSRGASSAVAIERDRRAHAFLKSTAEKLDVSDKMKLLLGDTYRLAPGLLGPPSPNAPLDDTSRIVFFCPPYAMWDSMLEQLNGLIRMSLDHLPPGSRIVAETDKHWDESQLLAGDWDHRLYGGTRLSFIDPPMQCGLRM
ncbi:RsmD family RNA methyltransferase [Stieleria sp. TO1_6]|uniref:RsmD family RNA methyltransferase n=1 Tax=Stieleria tagensis TaxID=2956795 RepID=UPI00209AA61E|nr:RsmD family RNA methyltransferase [Stieleria tagensis]MCO8123661.1 RsmD family RNA methyltransferase [Stieleria tagensis]